MIALNKSQTVDYADRDPDVRLMLQVRDGDGRAAEELARKYYPRVRQTIVFLLGNDDRSDDLTQEVFLRVIRASGRYQPQAKFYTWLFTIINNVVSNARRAAKNRREFHVIPADSGSNHASDVITRLPDPDPPTKEVELSEMRDIVRQGIRQLNNRQRTAIEAFYFHEMSCEKIAQQLQITAVATRSLLHRARAKLAEMFAPYVSEGHASNTDDFNQAVGE